MYKVLFDSANTTFDKISNDQSKLSLNKNHNIIIQSYEQTSGVGRGIKKWNSPRGNIYFTINQNKNTHEILKNSFYICYLIHNFFLRNFGIKFQYKWPNDLYFKKKKICGIVSTSKIIGNKSFTQTGVGFNLNKHPLKTSISLSKILNKNFSILETSSKLIKYLDRKIDTHISTTYLVNYLNCYLLREFKVNYPSFDPNKTKIIKVLNDLSLRIGINENYKNIFFGELI